MRWTQEDLLCLNNLQRISELKIVKANIDAFTTTSPEAIANISRIALEIAQSVEDTYLPREQANASTIASIKQIERIIKMTDSASNGILVSDGEDSIVRSVYYPTQQASTSMINILTSSAVKSLVEQIFNQYFI